MKRIQRTSRKVHKGLKGICFDQEETNNDIYVPRRKMVNAVKQSVFTRGAHAKVNYFKIRGLFAIATLLATSPILRTILACCPA